MKVDRRINRSKKALKDALILLLGKKDLANIRIKELVTIADLNRGTYYKHYYYKEEILDEIINEVIDNLITSYRDPYLNTNEFKINDLTASSVKIFEHVDAYANFYTAIINSHALPGFQTKICDVFKTLITHDLSDENSGVDVNTDLRASYYAYALFGIIIEWVNGDYQYTPKYMAEQLIKIIDDRPSNVIYKTTHKDATD
ncbi:AcrR family transcriptional regulator [Virgibacillus natechei]|uniref:AcrR family transcriptional regulator n=1 Tax=Virgibacillus natechei TaxID=1216297 RepID=A0ABS4IK22_9BACI|nr:TetR-like C-terminal domain-containing protein [Virgibacillus natechei]MBP1971312.1 AcrR family transcriptional regulator [Virgibacillus natechei]UZD12953.1 TetR family transcriptional regulator C-terminal domain-containing protein [Virgibacillus natechei]